MTAKNIAKELFDAGLQGEALYTAMWEWHDLTGLETRDMFTHYQQLQKRTGPSA
ncbi:hypothetical protein [Subtercola lobariae]|uniref:hypothetical protein n=1 Tax=Subtercola lobariae TaxID=1588641 RepID=UPI001667DDDD|nr:hypothetical protein [Subtercola lobariae]